jgi:2-(1,2-epoxy-1,2-dihydrophenyl)acetyl-CoA isomerase
MTVDRTDAVLVDKRDGIAVLTLNRPEARNAIDDGMREVFAARLREVAADDQITVVVLTGAGSAFCAGGDVKAMKTRLSGLPGRVSIDGWRRQRHTASFIASVRSTDQITIAAVNGPAVGLGMDLALACDFIVAAPEARFASSFVRRGLIPDGGSLYFLPRRIGLQPAKELIYSGRMVEADEALRLRLADRLAAPGALLSETRAFAEQFTGNSRPAISLMKSIVDKSYELPLEQIAALGGEAQAICYTTDEHRESVERFLAR